MLQEQAVVAVVAVEIASGFGKGDSWCEFAWEEEQTQTGSLLGGGGGGGGGEGGGGG